MAKFWRGSPISAQVLLTPSTTDMFEYSRVPPPMFALPR